MKLVLVLLIALLSWAALRRHSEVDDLDELARKIAADWNDRVDVERLARAICGSRPPVLPDDYRDDMFVDDECRALAARVAVEYARLVLYREDDDGIAPMDPRLAGFLG